ncbi:biotin-dependent carboxyltransferase family protein [Paenibacillus sp. KACC 21273]|uniref:5-oxoprolinase subunit C family protein n=1 Tax=Paenibacillus sp. KACC 21273 TaxID=3025665 RepID=UPI002365A616|nr:biotin-dependent carboxyltransferase family protein [Paenibacillus sp. KACC 21273]WDF49110.1 biotin-dependent carboxyltransferase family protein [Paenibacillus sp. KACC 21273]
MTILIHKPGLLCTIQDRGRKKYGKYGISISGAIDTFAHQVANRLVGNNEDQATLEITLSGWVGEFQSDQWIAITGGDLGAQIDGKEVPMWRPVWVRQGSILAFKRVVSGCRAYLAVSGGLALDKVMESRSTYLRAGIGGLEGRGLKKNDSIHIQKSNLRPLSSADLSTDPFYSFHWSVAYSVLPHYSQSPVIRIISGRQWDDFTQQSQRLLCESEYQITPQSDRMGYRLQGATLQLHQPHEYISEAVADGTIQVPVDGQPIVLMADRQTLGGYPKIAHVITVDLPVLAQLAPGASIRFDRITLAQAQSLSIHKRHQLQRLYRTIDEALRPLTIG